MHTLFSTHINPTVSKTIHTHTYTNPTFIQKEQKGRCTNTTRTKKAHKVSTEIQTSYCREKII